MNRRLYALHRWLSAVAFLQFAAWTISGTFFAIVPIETVRGTFVKDAHVRPLPQGTSVIGHERALAVARENGMAAPVSATLRALPSGAYWIVSADKGAVRVDATSGELSPVTREEAAATARRDQPDAPTVRSAQRLDVAPVEYRGKPLPAWRVELSDSANTAVYVDAVTGEVTSRRTDLWRSYDFFWGLHIMDYDARESFNHTLLRAAALLAALTVLSGLTLWILRAARWVRGIRARNVATAKDT